MVKVASVIALCLAVSGCVSTSEKRISAAAKQTGQAKAVLSLSDLPPDCVAKVGKVKIGDEPWVVYVKRWEALAATRDEKTENCIAWWTDYRAKISSSSN